MPNEESFAGQFYHAAKLISRVLSKGVYPFSMSLKFREGGAFSLSTFFNFRPILLLYRVPSFMSIQLYKEYGETVCRTVSRHYTASYVFSSRPLPLRNVCIFTCNHHKNKITNTSLVLLRETESPWYGYGPRFPQTP